MKTRVILVLVLLFTPLYSFGNSYLYYVETSMLNVSRLARDAVTTDDVGAFSMLNEQIKFLDDVLKESLNDKSKFLSAGTLLGVWKPIREKAKIITRAEGSIRIQREIIKSSRETLRKLVNYSNKIAYKLSQENRRGNMIYYSTAQVVFSEKMISSLNQLFNEEQAPRAMQDFVRQYKSYGRGLIALTKGDKQFGISALKLETYKNDMQKIKELYKIVGKLKANLFQRQEQVVKAQKALKYIREKEFRLIKMANDLKKLN